MDGEGLKRLKDESSKGAFGCWRSASLEVGGELAENMGQRDLISEFGMGGFGMR